MIIPIIWYLEKTLDLLITQIGLDHGMVESNPLFSVYLARWFNVATTFLVFFIVKNIKDKWIYDLIVVILFITGIDILHNLVLLAIN
jgi:hypothetical protein